MINFAMAKSASNQNFLSDYSDDKIEFFALKIKENLEKQKEDILSDDVISKAIDAFVDSGDFDYGSSTKYLGDIKNIDMILRSTVTPSTPLLRICELGGTRDINSHLYEMREDNYIIGDPSTFKLAETGTPIVHSSNPGLLYNKVMRLGFRTESTIEAKKVAVLPSGSNLNAYKFNQSATIHNHIKEYYLWFGEKTTSNETDGILKIFADNVSRMAYRKTYVGAAGSNKLQKADLDKMIAKCVKAGAMPENLVLFVPSDVLATISSWFEDKLIFTTDNFFSVNGLPSYKTTTRGNIPMIEIRGNIDNLPGAGTGKILSDKVILMERQHVGLTYLIRPITRKMPIGYVLQDTNTHVAEIFGLDYNQHLFTRAGMIDGIDAA